MPTPIEHQFGDALFGDIAEWMNDNLNPDDVFDKDTLIDWTKWNCNPTDIFSHTALGEWAEVNGYILDES